MTTIAKNMDNNKQVPYVKNTFVCVNVPREEDAAPARARSVSPRGSSDEFARQLYALLYRPTPVRQRSSGASGSSSRPEAITITRTPENEKIVRTNVKWADEVEKEAVGTPSTTPGPSGESGPSSPRTPESNLSEDELLRLVPRDANGALLSIGSVGHEEGTCKPCVFAFNENKPCGNGLRCSFCHYQHPPKKRVRLCKKKRMELKRQQEEEAMLEEEMEDQERW